MKEYNSWKINYEFRNFECVRAHGASLMFSWWRIHLQCRRPWFYFWVRKIPWRRDRLPTLVFLGFPCGSAVKESAYNAGDLGSIPRLGRYPAEGQGYLLQYSGLENSMDCIVHGVTKSRTWLSDSLSKSGTNPIHRTQFLEVQLNFGGKKKRLYGTFSLMCFTDLCSFFLVTTTNPKSLHLQQKL